MEGIDLNTFSRIPISHITAPEGKACLSKLKKSLQLVL
jgi:hypothetical protein